MSFLQFTDAGTTSSGKTKIWRVNSIVGGSWLGDIRWFPHWRKYVFAPVGATVYDVGCLREIADFCERVTREHKES